MAAVNVRDPSFDGEHESWQGQQPVEPPKPQGPVKSSPTARTVRWSLNIGAVLVLLLWANNYRSRNACAPRQPGDIPNAMCGMEVVIAGVIVVVGVVALVIANAIGAVLWSSRRAEPEDQRRELEGPDEQPPLAPPR